MKLKRFAAFLSVAILVCAAVWYLNPMEFEDLLPGYRPEEPVTACYAILMETEGFDDLGQVEIPTDSPAYEELMELLHSVTYTRNLTDLASLGRASDVQTITLKPLYATLYLRQGEEVYSLSFYGRRLVVQRLDQHAHSFQPKGKAYFQQQVVDLLAAQLPAA